MPEEDGYTFMQRVRKLPADRGGQVPAVALTAYTRVEDRTRALLAGFNVHLAKPVDATELLVLVANLCGRLTRTSP
jgi:CheY-like chemotaxis protein